jgi:hypothetical protein
MIHDNLCPIEPNPLATECRTCDLIAKVRADEAQKTEERVTERLYESWDADLNRQRYA